MVAVVHRGEGLGVQQAAAGRVVLERHLTDFELRIDRHLKHELSIGVRHAAAVVLRRLSSTPAVCQFILLSRPNPRF